jgi:aspartyl-tRNA(Asn)/glutamyl-tRNA(Gln) amidotransferase subunit A
VQVDAVAARVAAGAADRRRAAGRPLSLVDGLPISIKDLFDVEGQPTRAASRVLADAPPALSDAPVVQRLRAAGLVFLGRTQMSEFAFTGLGLNPHYPPLANALDPDRVPGGSSGGAAASVALGQACMGLGTDTGGSIRIPAAFTGLVGFKPTQGRITRAGVLPLSQSLDSVGPIARTVADCQVIDAILADGPIGQAPPRSGPLRLAVPDRVVFEGLEDAVGTAFDAAIRRLEAKGAEVAILAFSELAEIAHLNRHGSLSNAESFAYHRRSGFLEKRGLYDPQVLVRVEAGASMSAADYLDLVAARRDLMARAAARIAPYDAVLMPTASVLPPRLEDVGTGAFQAANALVLRNPSIVNILGGCAVSLPMTPKGAPAAGLTLFSGAGADAALFQVALAIESVVSAPP